MIDWFIKLSVLKFKPLILIYRRGNFYIIIEDIHQFNGYCLIPLDPWKKTHILIAHTPKSFLIKLSILWFVDVQPMLCSILACVAYTKLKIKNNFPVPMALNPINIRWIRTGSQPYWKLSCTVPYYIQYSTNIKICKPMPSASRG